jgi:dipeptidase E
MSEKRILALSSSRVGNSDYLEMAVPAINAMLGMKPLEIAFIPFAYVDEDKHPLMQMVRNAFAHLPYTISEVTASGGMPVLEDADAIMVSGGNTFKLLHDLYRSGLLNMVKGKVKAGTPYIGWSAGSNITGATICTTNDMPIIEPESFRALGFFPFQVNPHYYNQPVEGFNGETRDQRLTEFVKLNPAVPVVCLPEGTALLLEKGVLRLIGTTPGVLMKNAEGDMQKTEIASGADISYLLKM